MRILILIFVALLLISNVHARIVVRFDVATYEVSEEGDLIINVLIDGDDQTPGDQPVPNGLFSFGVKVTFASTNLEVSPEGLEVVSALDYNGFAPGALVQQQDGSILTKGNISLGASPTQPYHGNALFTLTMLNKRLVGAQYTLTLASARATPNETVFLDGAGNALDSTISFGTAQVSVIESVVEPFQMVIRPSPPSSVEVTFPVLPGRDHFVEVSADLRSWNDLFLVPINDGQFIVPATAGPRFFRVRTADLP